ncbi:DUF6090 family protein [Maribacter halichondriae]|uniref:DUF6090 family protein n=1 Tax=Maribacter halichondriae TaxID=2980554 RepID=UPI00235830F2|nr:DUF6090 family protein [Maribacter sp. Hal144]
MIKFFRKIRQRLLTENKFSKYLLYAIGEIVLVMIGILLALQVNNWNENRIAKTTVNRYLVSLVEDLKEDQTLLEQIQNIHSFRVHSLIYLRRQSGDPSFSFGPQQMKVVPFEPNSDWDGPIPTTYNLPFIEEAFSSAGRYLPMTVSSSSINELKNTGMFSNIQNLSLKKDIDQYYRNMEWVFFDEIHNESITKWNNSLLDSGIYYLQIAELPDPLDLITKNPERAAYLKNIIAEANYRSKAASNYYNKIDSLIIEIEQEVIQR